MAFPLSLTAAVEYFTGLGFDTLPLFPGSKRPSASRWQSRLPRELWGVAVPDSNIGIRGGGSARVAVLDFDDKKTAGTFQRGVDWLAGLGLCPGDYPLVRTASDVGRHVYAHLDGLLPGHSAAFRTGFGTGELRYGPGAYVVAPPSRIGTASYALLSGSFERLPVLAVGDLLPLLSRPADAGHLASTSLMVPRAEISRNTRALLRDGGSTQYTSRSEAEQAIVVGLVRAGYDFEDVVRALDENPGAGRFREECAKSRERALAWLRRGYEKAIARRANSEGVYRRRARETGESAQDRPWPGRTGQQDKVVFIAHTMCAARAGRPAYAASVRDLADITGLSPKTCARATKRLQRAGLIELVTPARAEYANIFRLLSQTVTLPHRGEGGDMCHFERE